MSRTGSSVTPLTFFGVLGYFQDVLSKLFYVRARLFRADLASWLKVDQLWPAELAFGYCNNSPVLLSDGSGNSAKGTTITINKCCNLTYSYSESYLEIFGVVISSTINFSICLCCCNDFWGLGTASLFGAAGSEAPSSLGQLQRFYWRSYQESPRY